MTDSSIKTVAGSETGDYRDPLPSSNADDFLAGLESEELEEIANAEVVDLTESGVGFDEQVDLQDSEPGSTPIAPKPRKVVERTYKPCTCQQFRVRVLDGDDVDTGCRSNVNSRGTFAPGHDAKLKSLLIKAGRLGQTAVRRTSEHGEVSSSDVVSLLAPWPKLAISVRTSLLLERRPSVRKPRPAEAEVSEMSEVKASRMAFIKVGRWTYEAEIDPAGTATYETKAGETKTVAFPDYAEVEADESPEAEPEF